MGVQVAFVHIQNKRMGKIKGLGLALLVFIDKTCVTLKN